MSEKLACRQAREGLTEYLENALPPRRRQGIEVHLGACGPCMDYFAQLRAVIAASARKSEVAIPQGMKSRLLRDFRERAGG